MVHSPLAGLSAHVAAVKTAHPVGRVTGVRNGVVHVAGLDRTAHIGDRVRIMRKKGPALVGEIVQLTVQSVIVLGEVTPDGVALDDRAILLDQVEIAPSDDWMGRIIDPQGQPLDCKLLLRGSKLRALQADPPKAAQRRGMGARIQTGLTALNTLLPIAQGQRVGLFAGSGVGKSSLLGHLARHMGADVIVIAMIGERGREIGEFVNHVLGHQGLARSVIVAATSDQSPLIRRRCAWTAMSVAEHFRDQGLHVLFLCDSITRFAEAHREVAVTAGEAPVLRGYPPSTAHQIMSLCERAGPGHDTQGDITAVFSVLVAGSDMEAPVADILRGALDGHIVLDRKIAEGGRYPAIDVLRSVSRCLPRAASAEENQMIQDTRRLLGVYDNSATLIQAGLYSEGSDAELDRAILLWPQLETFLSKTEGESIRESFAKLAVILRRGKQGSGK